MPQQTLNLPPGSVPTTATVPNATQRAFPPPSGADQSADSRAPMKPGPSAKDPFPVIDGKANPGFPYWSSGTITYRFDPVDPCGAGRTANILRAVKIIRDKTDGLVSFVQSPDGKVVMGCRNSPASQGARAWTSMGIDPEGLIHGASIDFLPLPSDTYECDSYPSLELHAILHAMGFGDTSSAMNVMNPFEAGFVGSPCREMDARMVNCLKNIYSNGRKGQSCTGIPHA